MSSVMIQFTRQAAEAYVKRNYGLNESDDNQFEDAVNRAIGESRETIDDYRGGRVKSGYEVVNSNWF